MWLHRSIQLPPATRGFHLITGLIERAVPEISQVQVGLLHVFIQHTSASLTINENADPDVPRDLEKSLDALAPESFPYEHTAEGPDDMPGHVKSVLIGATVSVPIHGGQMCLGTWQGIYLCEHRNHASGRKLVLTVQGEVLGVHAS